jgi:hypothetical protein
MNPSEAEQIVTNKRMTRAEIDRVRKMLKIMRYIPNTRKVLSPAVRKEVENILKKKEEELEQQNKK